MRCFYCADDPAERYSAQDTLRVQGSAYVGLGTRLISNKGRVMAHVTADTCGRHDTSAGCCSCESNAVRFGEETKYQHACRENFLLELSQHGLAQARHRGQPELLHERADRPVGKLHRRRRHLGAGQPRRPDGGDGCDLRHLELPADQQSLQRLQSDAGAGAGLGPARRLRFTEGPVPHQQRRNSLALPYSHFSMTFSFSGSFSYSATDLRDRQPEGSFGEADHDLVLQQGVAELQEHLPAGAGYAEIARPVGGGVASRGSGWRRSSPTMSLTHGQPLSPATMRSSGKSIAIWSRWRGWPRS